MSDEKITADDVRMLSREECDAKWPRRIFVPRETLVLMRETGPGRAILEWSGGEAPTLIAPDGHPQVRPIQRAADIEFTGYVRGVRFGIFITVGFILALGAAVRIGVAIWEMVR